MEIDLTDKDLTTLEKEKILELLTRVDKNIQTDLEQMWYLMDLVWDDYGCNNKNLEWDKISKFYSHPVWLLNGLFIEQHSLSMKHREEISSWVVDNKLKNIVDYGGGFGTLARLIAVKNKNISVAIYEPHPSDFGIKRAKELSNINIINKLDSGYDCLVCTDVLEHVPDPINSFNDMIKSVDINGYLIVANCFMPFIQCHLPQTFHLKYTFNFFAKNMGLEVVGILEGSHATIFRKIDDSEIDLSRIRIYEKISKMIFPVIEALKSMLRPIKKLFFK
ncbi:MAG: class I SAM-dependent methyltransferase [Marinomonas colpomeniae]